jgi:hypothetical protein
MIPHEQDWYRDVLEKIFIEQRKYQIGHIPLLITVTQEDPPYSLLEMLLTEVINTLLAQSRFRKCEPRCKIILVRNIFFALNYSVPLLRRKFLYEIIRALDLINRRKQFVHGLGREVSDAQNEVRN